MAEFWLNDGAGLRKAKALYFNDGTAVRTIKEAWFNDGAGVRKVFSAFAILTGQSLTCSLTTVINPQVRFETDATVSIENATGTLVAGGNWGSPATTGIGSAYWILVHQDSGSPVAGTLDTWLALSSFQAWTLTAATAGNVKSASLTYQIATDGSGSNAVTGGTISLVSDRS